jgi:predicted  nucleic acid-binding Zn-ribbon protein
LTYRGASSRGCSLRVGPLRMQKDEIQSRISELTEEEARLRSILRVLEDKAQAARDSLRISAVSDDVLRLDREIRDIVIRLSDIDRKRQELTVALSLL